MSTLAYDEVGHPIEWKPQGLQKAANGFHDRQAQRTRACTGNQRIAPNEEYHGAGDKSPFSIDLNHAAIMPPHAAA